MAGTTNLHVQSKTGEKPKPALSQGGHEGQKDQELDTVSVILKTELGGKK